MCVVVTSLDRSQTLESLQKVSSLGRLRNECLHFSRFFFFGFFFLVYTLGHSRSGLSPRQFLAACRDFGSQSGARGLRQQRAEHDNHNHNDPTPKQSATAYGSVHATCPNHVDSANQSASRAACASASADGFE